MLTLSAQQRSPPKEAELQEMTGSREDQTWLTRGENKNLEGKGQDFASSSWGKQCKTDPNKGTSDSQLNDEDQGLPGKKKRKTQLALFSKNWRTFTGRV